MKSSLKYGFLGMLAMALLVSSCNSDEVSSKRDTPKSEKSTLENKKDEAVKSLSADGATKDKKANQQVIDTTPVGPLTTMVFEEMAHDYGDIKQDTENEHIFKFTNTGTEPLIISKAKGSCGCTVPEYPETPIAPGESDMIKVVYKPGKQKDKQNKTVTITANTEPSTTVLRISANVSPVEG